MEGLDQIAEKLNAIPWRTAAAINPEAEKLIHDHIAKMQAVLNHLAATGGLAAEAAYAKAQTAGSDEPGYDAFMHMLFRRVTFRNAVVREPLILTIASSYFWDKDRELNQLPNPWLPLLKLYEQGYTSSFEENDRSHTIDLLIGYKSGIERYRLA
jgi:hypothetical protein